jgi:ribosomal protein L33
MTDQEQAVREIGRRMAKEETTIPGLDTAFPAGLILACSDCGEGLYKVTARATTADLVLDDGTILQPLNTTIPPHDAWKSLVCVKCGGRVYKEGKIHTVQEGWK